MNSQEKNISNKRYIIETLLLTLIGLPILIQVASIAIGMLIPNFLAAIALASLVIFPVGYWWARKKNLPTCFLPRYLPVLAPLIYSLLAWAIVMAISKGDFTHSSFGDLMGLFIPFMATNIIAFFTGSLWILLLTPVVCYISFALGLTVGAKRSESVVTNCRGRLPALILSGILLIIIAFQGYQRETHLVTENRELTVNETISLWDYAPFKTEDNRLTSLSSPATISIDKDWPRIDGATAAYPVYASAVQALYKGLDENSVSPYIHSRRTPEAYHALIAGETDLIFVAQPSDQQKKLAADNGLTLTMIPFAREAFVFIAHKDNPVKNLSVEQIRDIYSGQITNWQAVGGQNINIIPYQRPEGSGSQTTMLAKVMQDTAMRKPLESEIAEGMGGIIRRVANYQNTSNALGYSFRYYASQMNHNDQLQLLSVNNIAPTAENIRNGSYPFSVNVYMVTARQPTANTQKLMDWFLSPQGQKLTEDVGYVPIGATH
ncbi:PstS family phosphate ABC transporter substrate-binding protein [Budviciaceae bacterium BWR-B9]|uniref:PstS family phosphate ABC transporter substrate-binding protein n=1 Tax=Limnobaculum allomyrinae TaxID=2791986 RepID=A0ABS1IUQ1_9GAMM|nr:MULTISPECIES: PstS family phosphate ABC transporter substrate-binding protein [Limnobaculum]MBK5145261.1 PstS family phosphate ABC transporter substrate-binding protein [Limnobaculum allomyrinae]MBV7693093.1 PstS family phosphate ABC transporter substrate-binding protein [Limnobaculum sp. M2-1]